MTNPAFGAETGKARFTVPSIRACATPRLQSDIEKRAEEKLQVLLRRNQELIEHIRYYEAKLDTLQKMRSAPVKGLYCVR